MKVDVQKPIQSLHAFVRHHFGGEPLGSFPVFRSTIAVMSILLLGSGMVSAQDRDRSDSNAQVNEEKRLDLLFDRIMQTLPEGERTRVDSAATVKVDRNTVNGNTSAQPSEHEKGIAPRERLKELPDELKVQVERAITDMEKRKEDRKAQFRESLRNR